MIKVKFKKCYEKKCGDFYTKEYDSLKALEDEIFSMVACDYDSALNFPFKKVLDNEVTPISVLPMGTFCEYVIFQIDDEDKGTLFLAGEIEESIITCEMEEWIKGCRERMKAPKWFVEGFKPVIRRQEIQAILEDDDAVLVADKDDNMRVLMKIAKKDIAKAIANMGVHKRCLFMAADGYIPLVATCGNTVEKVHSLFMSVDEAALTQEIKKLRREPMNRVSYITKQSEMMYLRSRVELIPAHHLAMVG